MECKISCGKGFISALKTDLASAVWTLDEIPILRDGCTETEIHRESLCEFRFRHGITLCMALHFCSSGHLALGL